MTDVAHLRIVYEGDVSSLDRATTKANALIDDFKKKAATTGDVNFDGDTSDLNRAVKDALLELSAYKIKAGQVGKVGLDANATPLKNTLRTVSAELDKFGLKSPTVDLNANKAGAIKNIAEVDAALKALPNNTSLDVNVKTAGASARLAALNAEMVGTEGDSVASSMSQLGSMSGPIFAGVIAGAIGVAVAALAPLMGGAAAGGSAVAGVLAGYGLIAAAGKHAFGELQQVGGKWVVKTKSDATKNLNALASYMNKVGASYQKAIQPAANAFAGFAADVLKQVNKIIPYMGTIAQKTVQKTHSAFDQIMHEMTQPREIDAFKRITDAIPGLTANFTHALGNFGVGLGNILSDAVPDAKALVGWFDHMSSNFVKWTNSRAGRQEIGRWLHDAAQIGPVVAKAIGDIALGLIHLSENPAIQAGLKAVIQGIGAIGSVLRHVFDIPTAPAKRSGEQAAKAAHLGFYSTVKKNASADQAIFANIGRGSAAALGGAVKKWAAANNQGMFASLWKGINVAAQNGPAQLGAASGASFRKQWAKQFSGSHQFDLIKALFGKNFADMVAQQWHQADAKQKAALGTYDAHQTYSFKHLKQNTVGIWDSMFGGMLKTLNNAAKNFQKTLGNFETGAVRWVKSLPGKVGHVWQSFWSSDLGKAIANAGKAWAKDLSNFASSAVNWIKSLPGKVGNAWHNFWDGLGKTLNNVEKTWGKDLSNFASSAVNWVKSLPGKVGHAWQNFWQGVSNALKNSNRDWGNVLSNFLSSAVNWVKSLPSKVGTAWHNFWQNAADWLNAKKQGMLQTLSNWMSSAVSWVKSLPSKVGTAWHNFWQNTADWLNAKKQGMLQTLSNWMSSAVSWVKSLPSKIGTAWHNFWQNAADWLVTKKDGMIQTLGNWMSSAVSWVKSLPSKIGTLWNKFWQGAADFVVEKKNGILQTMSNLVSGVETWWKNLISFINKVLNAVGLPTIGGLGSSDSSSGSGSSSSGGGGGNSSKPNSIGPGGNVTGHARGGVHMGSTHIGGETFASGGLSGPRKPRMHIWGEGDHDEGFITTDPKYRRENLFYLKMIAAKLGQVVVPGGEHGGDFGGGERAKEIIARGGHMFGAGGLTDAQIQTYMQRGNAAIGAPYKYGSNGTYHMSDGYTCSGLWDWIMSGQHAPTGNGTYDYYRGLPGWESGGGQVEIQVTTHGVAGDGTHMWGDINGTSFEATTTQGVHHGYRAGTVPPYATAGKIFHVGSAHAAATGSGSGSTQSLWQTAGNALWNRLVQPRLDAMVKNAGPFVLDKAAAKESVNVADAIKNYIINNSGGSGGGSGGIGSGGSFDGGGNAMNWMVESLKRDSLPASWAHDGNLWNIANSESGTTQNHVVWTPDGPKYMAPWGMIVPNRYGVTPGSPQIDRFAVGPRYVKDQYGTPEKAWAFHKAHNWYGNGGVLQNAGPVARHIASEAVKRALVIGDDGGIGTGRSLVGITNEAGPEAIIPKRRTPEGLQALRQAEQWHGPQQSGGALPKNVETILKAVEERLKHIDESGIRFRDVQALLDMALRVQDSTAGLKHHHARNERLLSREITKMGEVNV